jgi:hypothetical protein
MRARQEMIKMGTKIGAAIGGIAFDLRNSARFFFALRGTAQ